MKKFLLPAALALVFLISCSEKSPQEKRDELHSQAMEYLNNFEFDKADSAFLDVLAADTMSFLGPEGLALSQERQMMWWDALHYYIKILSRNPESLPATLGAMRVYHRLGMSRMAIERAAYALRLAPESNARAYIAKMSMEDGQPSPVLRQAEQTDGNLMPDPIRYALLARAHFMMGNYDDSRTYLDSALAANESSALFKSLMADAYEARGAYDSAMVFSRLAYVAGDADFQNAIDRFLRAIRLEYWDDAKEVADSVFKVRDSSTLWTAMSYELSRAKWEHMDMLNLAGQMLDKKPYALTPYMLDINARSEVGDYMTCSADLAALQSLLERRPFEPVFVDLMQYQLALINVTKLDDPLGALRELEKLWNQRLSDEDYRYWEAYLLHNTGQMDQFAVKVDSFENSYGRTAAGLTRLGTLHGDSTIRRYDEAAKYFEKALEKQPSYRPAFEGYLDMYRHQRASEKAVALFDRYPQFYQHIPELAARRAIYLVQAGQDEAGTDAFIRVFPHISGDMALMRKIFRELRIQQYDDGIQRIAEMLVDSRPEDGFALTMAADQFNRLGDHERAMAILESAPQDDQNIMNYRVQLAWTMYNLGQKTEAFDRFEKIYQENPDDHDMLLYYSKALATEEQNLMQAQNLARQAVFTGWDVLDGWLNLSYVYMMSGRADLAWGEASKAVNSFPYSAEAYYYLGYGKYLEGKDGARESLTKAIDMGLRGEDLQRAQKALKELS